jgi:uncharacterized repeat protein (TIGR04138 family)
MSLTTPSRRFQLRFHPQAYVFVTEALRLTQELLGREHREETDEASAHITGRELLDGVRLMGQRQFGMLAPSVFKSWGVQSTEDFGLIVFELIERGELRKTDRDQLSDFRDVYTFDTVFGDEYRIDTSRAFST